MKKLITSLLLTSVLFLSACAHHGAAYIQSRPTGAEVVDLKTGVILGVTPVKVWWEEPKQSRKFVNIRIQKEGYQDKTSSFWVTLRHSDREKALTNAQSVEMTLDKVK
ncbi:MAG: hypothetical protein V3V09_04310 [Arenicellales bacterium]